MDKNINKNNQNQLERYQRVLLLLEQAEAELEKARQNTNDLETEINEAIDEGKRHKVLNFIKTLPNN